MTRFSVAVSRSRDEQASENRYQLQTDDAASRPQIGDADGSEELSPLTEMRPDTKKGWSQ
jgi:hypothetical protein